MAECDLADCYAVLCSIDEKLAWQNDALKKIVDAAVDVTAPAHLDPRPGTVNKFGMIQEGSLMKMKDPTVDPTFPRSEADKRTDPKLNVNKECLRRGHIWSGPAEVDSRWCLRCGEKVNV